MQFRSRNNLNSSLCKMSEPTLFHDLGHVACSTRRFFVFVVLLCCSTCAQTYQTRCWGLVLVSPTRCRHLYTTYQAFFVLYEQKLCCRCRLYGTCRGGEECSISLMPLCSYEGMSRLAAQPFNPFVPTQE